jgi:hypothetical protein
MQWLLIVSIVNAAPRVGVVFAVMASAAITPCQEKWTTSADHDCVNKLPV